MFFCILFNYTILRDTKVRARRSAGVALGALKPPTTLCTEPLDRDL